MEERPAGPRHQPSPRRSVAAHCPSSTTPCLRATRKNSPGVRKNEIKVHVPHLYARSLSKALQPGKCVMSSDGAEGRSFGHTRFFFLWGIYIFLNLLLLCRKKKKRLKMTTGSFLSLGIPQHRPGPASSVSVATVPAPHVRPAPLLAPRVLRAPPPCRPAACARPSLAPPGEPRLENPAGEPRWRTPPGEPHLENPAWSATPLSPGGRPLRPLTQKPSRDAPSVAPRTQPCAVPVQWASQSHTSPRGPVKVQVLIQQAVEEPGTLHSQQAPRSCPCCWPQCTCKRRGVVSESPSTC